MKNRKLIAVIMLVVILALQFSFIQYNYFVYAKDTLEDNVSMNFHYAQLNTEAQKIYNALYSMYINNILKTGTQDYDLVANGYFTEEEAKKYENGNSELIKAMNVARYAFYADYPEIFYVNFPKLTLRTTKGSDGSYHIYIGSGRYKNYYIDGFYNQEQVENAIKEFDARVNEIVQGANNLEIKEGTNKKVEQIKYVHDEIINNVSYRLEDTCYEGNESFLGTPYGTLVKKQGVCEGYSRAFKTILDKLGINCILVQGVHQYSGEAAVAHMWNYVQIEEQVARQAEGKWYAVDLTQDDPETYVYDEKDRINYMNNFDSYGLDGFEGIKYLLAGQIVMNERHFPNGVIEAAGNFEFEYPVLEDESYGTTNAANADGLSVTYRPNAQVTEDSASAEFKVSYRGMGAAKAIEQGIYILVRYNVYDEKTDSFTISPWCYVLPEVYVLDDHDEYFNIYENQAMYMEFAATTVKPVKLSETDFEYLRYRGDDLSIVARTEKIYNENSGYMPPPYIKTQTPGKTSTLDIREKPYHVKAVWDEELVLSEGYTEENIGFKLECLSSIGEAVTGDKYTKITNLTWNGTDTVEFDIKFSQMYADDNVSYIVNFTGLVGKNSKKTPNPVTFSARTQPVCPCVLAKRNSWELFGKPTLLESKDLSTNDWKTSTGVPVSEKLKDRITLVTTETTKEQTEKMEELMQENFPNQEVISSSTYNITLCVCKTMVVKTGQKVKVKLGFPEGYGPEDEGVTYKAYHFKRNAIGEVIGVEEIDCVVTQYGLIITCDAFSPFTIAAVKSDETAEVQKNKTVIVTSSEGGTITGENIDATKIITLSEDGKEKISVKPDEGYEIESITVCGNEIDLTNKDAMDITVNYNDIQNANNIVHAEFVAKEVVTKEEERGEVPVKPVAVPAEITIKNSVTSTINKTLRIVPVVSETPGIQTYQWYKDGVKLEGKTSKVLEIENSTIADEGSYVLKVTTTVETVSVEVESSPCVVTIRSFGITLNSESEDIDLQNLEPGQEFVVNVSMNDFYNLEKGLISLMGELDYDSDVLEKIEVIGKNGWSLESYSSDTIKFKFITDNSHIVLDEGEIFSIKFKVKDITDNTNTVVKIKGISASGGYGVISADDAELGVGVKIVEKISSEIYEIDNENSIISKIAPETTVANFKTNVTTKQQIKILDKDGNALEEEDVLGTGMTIKVGKTLQYTIVVTGDIDGDAEITVNDLAKLKLHLIEKEFITQNLELIAADVDNDNEITINDVAKIKLVLIGPNEKE